MVYIYEGFLVWIIPSTLYEEDCWKCIANFSWINEKLQPLKCQLQERENTQAQIFSLFKARFFA